MKRICFLLLSLLLFSGQAKFAPFQAASGLITKSPLGQNSNFFGQDAPLLNAIKYGTFLDTRLGGSGTGETSGLLQNNIDANGYPLSFSFTSTFTACISSVSGACGGSSGTVIWVSALGTGTPWNNGGISGAGVTGGTTFVRALGSGTAAVTGGNLLTVTVLSSGVFGPGMTIYDANGHHYGVITTNGTGTGGTGTYNLSGGVNIASTTLNAVQPEATTGTYVASVSQHVASTTITESNLFTFVQIDGLFSFGGASITPPSGQFYQAGTWVFAYDGGDGTTAFTFGGDFAGMAKCTGVGRYVSTNVTGSGGTDIAETVVGSPYPKNWRLIYSPGSSCSGCPSSCTVGTNEALFNSGETFNPDFINRMQPFKAFRMMNWQAIISNTLSDWNFRRSPTWIFWNDSPSIAFQYHGPAGGNIVDGVPIEAQVALCNKINADCWFNMPVLANDTYITNMATLVHNGTTDSSGHVWAGLNSGLKAYTEYGNELWNFQLCSTPGGLFTENCQWAVADLDISFYPQDTGFSNQPFNSNQNVQALQAVRIAKMWRSAWGADSSRIKGVFGGWAAVPTQAQTNTIWGLGITDPGPNNIGPTYYTGTVGSNLDVLAIAPYIGNGGCPGADLNAFFAQAASDETDALSEVPTNKTIANSFSLVLDFYESGFQYTGGSTLCRDAMRDPRAGTMYTDYYTQSKNDGADLMTHFMSVGPFNASGYYGSLESIVETTSPRYDALKNFR